MELPQIFAFYSFKGGVGRTMALLNLAYALVAKGRNVLVLDMDLEAPGLSGFMNRQKEIAAFAHHDMVDLLRWAKQTAQQVSEDAPLDKSSLPPLSDYAIRVPPEKLESIPHRSWDIGRLDVIPIDESRDYYARLSEVATGSMDRDTLLRVGSLLRSWLKSRRIPLEVPDYYGNVPDEDRSAPYDYVFIDSRTGITEVGGLCIGPLSDQLIVLCGLNDQNVEGTRQFLTEVGVLTPESDMSSSMRKPTLFVASPLPIGEMTTKTERLNRLIEALGPMKPKLFKLSYHPQMALMETIFVRDHEDEMLAQEYGSILNQLLERAESALDFDPMMFFGPWSSRTSRTDQMRNYVLAFLRSRSLNESAQMFFAALVENQNLETVTDNREFQLMDRICRVVASEDSPAQLSTLGRWSDVLSRWSRCSADPDLAQRRFAEAIALIDYIIESPKTSSKGQAIAILNRAIAFAQHGVFDRAINDFTTVVESSDAPVEQKSHALFNRGVTFGHLGQHDRAIEDYTAAIKVPGLSADERATVLVNRGVALGILGVHENAIADYTEVIQMQEAPAEQKANALTNRGLTFAQNGDNNRAVADCTAVIGMPDAPAEQRAKALVNRGSVFRRVGNFEHALADYTTAIEVPAAPIEVVATALINRANLFRDHDQLQRALTDYTAVIEMRNAPDSQKSNAYHNRGWAYFSAGQIRQAICDTQQAAAMRPRDVTSLGNLAIMLLVDRQMNEALALYDKVLELSDSNELVTLANELSDAIAKHGELPGADDAQKRIESRVASLKANVEAK